MEHGIFSAPAGKRDFVRFCRNLSLKLGFTIGKRAEKQAVLDLVNRLHPRTAEHGLVRLGGTGDGGYLVPDDFEGIEACFSPGVCDRANFEIDMIARGIRCYLTDASVEKAPIADDLVHFTRKFLAVVNGSRTITLDDWVNAHAPGTSDLLLQMDIEGAEWPVLLHVSPQTLRRFRIIVVELHDLERMLDRHALPMISAIFDRLLDDFYVVHNHPNNYAGVVQYGSLTIPRVIEMTLYRKDRVVTPGFASQFPHPLDQDCAVGRRKIVLPPGWFRAA